MQKSKNKKELKVVEYFSVKRFLNAFKIISSFLFSRLIRRPFVWGLPISYSIEPTNHCNLKCPECPSGLGTLTRPLGLMQIELFKKLIDEISSTGFYIQLFFQGEPYINKNLSKMIEYAQSKKMYVSVSTNGSFIYEKNIEKVLSNAPDKLIFSIDGLDEISYQKYRVGGQFEKVDTGLKLLTGLKKKLNQKKPFIELQFIVMKHNEHQLDEVIKYGKMIEVDKVTFKTMQVSSIENANTFLPVNEKYRRYIFDGKNLYLKNKMKNHCFALWRTSVITWDGKVVPCCFDKDAEYELGVFGSSTFKEIWNSKYYNEFRKRILQNRRQINICNNCTEGLKMNILEIEN